MNTGTVVIQRAWRWSNTGTGRPLRGAGAGEGVCLNLLPGLPNVHVMVDDDPDYRMMHVAKCDGACSAHEHAPGGGARALAAFLTNPAVATATALTIPEGTRDTVRF